MALKAKLHIDRKVYDVQSLDYKLEFPRNKESGKPAGMAEGGDITFTVLANKADNSFFQRWISEFKDKKMTRKSGFFELPVTDKTDHQTYRLDFDSAIITSLAVKYTSYSDKQMTMTVTLLAQEMIFDAKEGEKAKITNEWLVRKEEKDAEAAKAKKEKEDLEAAAKKQKEEEEANRVFKVQQV